MTDRRVTLDLSEAARAYRDAITALEELAQPKVLTSAKAMRIFASLALDPARSGLAKLEGAIVAVNRLNERLQCAGRALESIDRAALATLHELGTSKGTP